MHTLSFTVPHLHNASAALVPGRENSSGKENECYFIVTRYKYSKLKQYLLFMTKYLKCFQRAVLKIDNSRNQSAVHRTRV